MSVTEFERHQILQWFQESMGPERGAIMMKLIAPVGWGDIATNHDLHELEARLDARFRVLSVELRGEMAELRADVRSEIAELRGEIAVLRGEMMGMKGEIARSVITWVLASQATLVGLVLAAVRLG